MSIVELVSKAAKELGMGSDIVELAGRVLSDASPGIRDCYLFGQTVDNEDSVFGGAAALEKRIPQSYWISDGAAADGYPGYVNWKQKLSAFVPEGSIKPVPMPPWVQGINAANGFNLRNVSTISESRSLVTLARAERIFDWNTISAEFHIMRAYMTLVTENLRVGGNLNFYAVPGTPLPWEEVVVHSQGKQVASRAEILRDEMKKIRDWTNIIHPVSEILRYMDQRPAFKA